jgi:uncharacterized protein
MTYRVAATKAVLHQSPGGDAARWKVRMVSWGPGSPMGYNGFMIPLVESNRARLQDLCRRYGVRRLELFGSAATNAFDPVRSDLDFLVEFFPEQELGPWLRHYFEFQAELARLFGRPVDLVLSAAVRSRYFQREMDRTRTVLYAA